MPKHPIVLVHGYSDKGQSFERWCQRLEAAGYDATTIHLGNYVSLSNEITIKDIAEGFDRALSESPGAPIAESPSTPSSTRPGCSSSASGSPGRSARSTTGACRRAPVAPQAPDRTRAGHLRQPDGPQGRSWLGAIFKGGKEFGPDFMEAGDLVLSGLELGSAYTWDLAHRDFLATRPCTAAAARRRTRSSSWASTTTAG
jgi:hypothetical protein